jgi:hypothetical protein
VSHDLITTLACDGASTGSHIQDASLELERHAASHMAPDIFCCNISAAGNAMYAKIALRTSLCVAITVQHMAQCVTGCVCRSFHPIFVAQRFTPEILCRNEGTCTVMYCNKCSAVANFTESIEDRVLPLFPREGPFNLQLTANLLN